MHLEKTRSCCVVATLLMTATYASAQTLPPDQFIEYSIRETPTDPASNIVFTVTLKLQAADQDGDSIAWRVLSAAFTKVLEIERAPVLENFSKSHGSPARDFR